MQMLLVADRVCDVIAVLPAEAEFCGADRSEQATGRTLHSSR